MSSLALRGFRLRSYILEPSLAIQACEDIRRVKELNTVANWN